MRWSDNCINRGEDVGNIFQQKAKEEVKVGYGKVANGIDLGSVFRNSNGCSANRGSTSPLCGHDSSKDGNGSDLRSGKVGNPSIVVFINLRGQVSGVEIGGEHVSSQLKASNRRRRKVRLAPTRHCIYED
ncbi:hypothetical protein LWI28_012193 [Acer negundo]|uniref:Uncharacterized protein n=1 Tax=Acer negundo TaxID=4023 RepID=A0AAD5P1S5_ACENE|nr:hypothetical protein LWI28_012193 [Acer negundo]